MKWKGLEKIINNEYMHQAAEKLYLNPEDYYNKSTKYYVDYKGKYLGARRLIRDAYGIAISEEISGEQINGGGGKKLEIL